MKGKTILLILTAVLLVAGGVVWYSRKEADDGKTPVSMQPAQSPATSSPATSNALDITALEKELGIEIKEIDPPTSTVDTSGWKTYRNEKYGFEVKYPPEYVIKKSEPILRSVNIHKMGDGSVSGILWERKTPQVATFALYGKDKDIPYYINILPLNNYSNASIPDGVERGYDAATHTWWENYDANGKQNYIPPSTNGRGWIGYEFNDADAGSVFRRIAIPNLQKKIMVEFSIISDFDTPAKIWKQSSELLNAILKTLTLFPS